MSFQPQTPQSPSQLSPNGTELFSSSHSTMAATSSTLPTPAHSVSGTTAIDGGPAEDSPQKRKRPLDDLGDRGDSKKAHTGERALGIDSLHENVGELYLLCRTRKTPLPVAYLRRAYWSSYAYLAQPFSISLRSLLSFSSPPLLSPPLLPPILPFSALSSYLSLSLPLRSLVCVVSRPP